MGVSCGTTGYNSFAFGSGCTSDGQSSFAFGSGCIASGDYAHAEGQNTKASSLNQHVQGKYNVEDTESKYAFIIGNGTYDKRSNAIAIDWDGNIYVDNSATGVNVLELKSFLNVLGERTTTLETSNDNWGDYNPNMHSEYPMACETHYIESDKFGGKRTFAVVPKRSEGENNALVIRPDGLYVVDLAPQIEALESTIGDIKTVLENIVEVTE